MERSGEIVWDPNAPNPNLTNEHWVILGSSGTGKTQTIMAVVGELAQQGVIPVILDFNDDYYKERKQAGPVGDFFSKIGANRVHISKDGLPINPLEPSPDPDDPTSANVMEQIYSLADNLQKVFALGDQQNSYLRSALKATYEDEGITPGWVDIKDTKFPVFSLLKEKLENPSWTDKPDEKMINRLQPIFDLNIFRSGEEGSFEDMMKTPSILRLTNLPGNKTKEAVAELFLMAFYNFMLRQPHSPGKLKYLIVVDEAHKISNLKAMDLLMRESRKYGVGVVVSSQQAADFKETVFANAGTLLTLRLQENKDIKKVAQLIAGGEKPSDVEAKIRKLNTFEGIFFNDQYKNPHAMVKVEPYYERPWAKNE